MTAYMARGARIGGRAFSDHRGGGAAVRLSVGGTLRRKCLAIHRLALRQRHAILRTLRTREAWHYGAQVEFERIKALVSQDLENWELWFRLGECYDASGDRKLARKSIRKAIKLANNPKSL